MDIYKFGGASIATADRIKNIAGIIGDYKGEGLLVVISAMGKTTNALEVIAQLYHEGETEAAHDKVEELGNKHLDIVDGLFENKDHPVYAAVRSLFNQLLDIPKLVSLKPYDFLYDQVVCFGELLSTTIVSHYLNEQKTATHWLDVRTVLRTDKAYREAKILWPVSKQLIQDNVKPLLTSQVVLTQGFIGSTEAGFTTTLGREGSDFTAAIFANMLDAEMLTIWKDVPGVLNCNPTQFDDAVKIDELSYKEAIEQTFYGAQVIHPKTIKPLQNKSIPLHVRSFIEKQQQGTLIKKECDVNAIPPVIVYKGNQILLKLSTIDFSFMAEENLRMVYDTFTQLRIKINLMQNTAISLLVSIDDHSEKIQLLTKAFGPHFTIQSTCDTRVLTIRHYTSEVVNRLTKDEQVLITQQRPATVQFVLA